MKFIKIFSDSLASVVALDKNTFESKTVLHTHEELNKLSEKTRAVTVTWIKAHYGHDGNKLADEYAKVGTLDPSSYELSLTTRT